MRKLGLVILAAGLAACVAVAPPPAPRPAPGKSHGHGPPAHAPAHGYRAKTPQGVEVAFDTRIGVYVVVQTPSWYWLDDRYYRKGTAGWLVSAGFEGPWTACAAADLPAGLQRADLPPGKTKAKKGNGR